MQNLESSDAQHVQFLDWAPTKLKRFFRCVVLEVFADRKRILFFFVRSWRRKELSYNYVNWSAENIQ